MSNLVQRPDAYAQAGTYSKQAPIAFAGAGLQGLQGYVRGAKGGAMNAAFNGSAGLVGLTANPKGRLAQIRADQSFLGVNKRDPMTTARTADYAAGGLERIAVRKASAALGLTKKSYVGVSIPLDGLFPPRNGDAVDHMRYDEMERGLLRAIDGTLGGMAGFGGGMLAAAKLTPNMHLRAAAGLGGAALGVTGGLALGGGTATRSAATRARRREEDALLRAAYAEQAAQKTSSILPPGASVGATAMRALPKLVAAPLAVGGVFALDRGYRGTVRLMNRLAEEGRYENAMGGLDPSEFGDPAFAQRYEDDPTSMNTAMREAFSVLNRAAPSVAKNPVIAREYMRRMVLDPTYRQPPEEYLRQLQQAVSLENALQSSQPSLFDGIGGMAAPMVR